MDAPKCKICGEKHYGPLCRGVVRAAPRLQAVTMAVPHAPLRDARAACPQCALYAAEVRKLKKELAEARKPAETHAKRMRAYRERKRIQEQ